jgi:hypothetical protein
MLLRDAISRSQRASRSGSISARCRDAFGSERDNSDTHYSMRLHNPRFFNEFGTSQKNVIELGGDRVLAAR